MWTVDSNKIADKLYDEMNAWLADTVRSTTHIKNKELTDS